MKKDRLAMALAQFITEAKRLLEETHEAEDRQIYEKYLAHAGVILARIIQGQDIGSDIDTMERLFGHTWLKDGNAYAKAYATWNEFKRLFKTG